MRNLILITLALIFTTSSNALTVNISVVGQNVRYENSRDWGTEYYVTTTSEIFASLEPTKKWIPAMSRANSSVTLTGPSSEQATVQVIIHGLEYDWGSLSNSTSNNNNMGLESGFCNSSKTSSMTTIINNSLPSCISSVALTSKSDMNNIPFYFIRPVFELKGILPALKGKPEGLYVGSIIVPFRYYFYNDMSVLTYRNLSFNFALQVKHNPEVFTSLIVTPENGGVISPQYGAGVVKGETKFNIEALGYFNTGIKMKFDTSKDFSLVHDSQVEKKIPYYIHCDSCVERTIVGNDGKLTASVLSDSGVVLALVGSDKSRINYKLTVGYSDKTINEVITGGYSDSFVVVFGLDF